MIKSNEELSELIKQEMDLSTEKLQHLIALSFFRPSIFDQFLKPPETWRGRWRRRWQRACAYLYTVWRALRGDELDTPNDYW